MAMFKKIKIAHIHGGEVSAGAMDEKIRHSISKMSDLHFRFVFKKSKKTYSIRRGSKRIFKVGALCNDNINSINLLKKKVLEKELNFLFIKKTYY